MNDWKPGYGEVHLEHKHYCPLMTDLLELSIFFKQPHYFVPSSGVVRGSHLIHVRTSAYLSQIKICCYNCNLWSSQWVCHKVNGQRIWFT